MHIFRWLMKHPILLAWLLAVLAILLNFSMGGKASHEVAGGHGKETAPKEAAAAGSHAQVAAPAAPAVATGHVQGNAAAPAQQGMAGHEQAAAAPQVQVAAPAAEQAAAPAQQGMAATPAPAQQAAGIADAANAINQQQGMAASTDAAVPAPAAGGDATAAAETPANLLRAAREAYWSNELDNAVEFYTKLIQQEPSLDNKGELANVYWMQGNAKQAAALFAEIAPQRAAEGRMSQALNMKLYVDMVDPELAKQVDAALKK